MSLQRLYDSCLLLCTAISCMFWTQKADLYSPLTMEGMSGIACCPGKSASKRDTGHPPGSTLWQSILPIAYFILTCGNIVLGNRGAILPMNLKFSIYFQVSWTPEWQYVRDDLSQSLYFTSSLFKTVIIWNERKHLREKRYPHILILLEERIHKLYTGSIHRELVKLRKIPPST